MRAVLIAFLASGGFAYATAPQLQSYESYLEEVTINEQAAIKRRDWSEFPVGGAVEDGGRYWFKDSAGRMTDMDADNIADRSTLHIMSGRFTQADLDDMHRRHPRRILCFAGDAGPCVSYNPRIFEILTVEEEPTS